MMFLLDALTIGAIGCIGSRLIGVVGTPIVRAFRVVFPNRDGERRYYRAAHARWRIKYGR